MDTVHSRQEELADISLALEEDDLVLALFGQSIAKGTGISAPKAVQARLLYRLSNYLNQHATDLKLLGQKRE